MSLCEIDQDPWRNSGFVRRDDGFLIISAVSYFIYYFVVVVVIMAAFSGQYVSKCSC